MNFRLPLTSGNMSAPWTNNLIRLIGKTILSNYSVVYKFKYAGCNSSYVGETECILHNRTPQHACESKESAEYKHLDQCSGFTHIKDIFSCENYIDLMEFRKQAIWDNRCILAKEENLYQLGFLESLLMKEHAPELSIDIKASKTLQLF